MTMLLRYSAASPYVRKVRVLAIETRLDEIIDLVETDAHAKPPELTEENPLGKVPTLITDDGLVLFDSPVICEYLDSAHGGTRMVPVATPGRWHVLRLQSVGDGIMDAAVAIVMEGRRPESEPSREVIERETDRIVRALDWLADNFEELGGRFNLGQIAVACALGYLDFRLPQLEWRSGRTPLANWFEAANRRDSMRKTRP